jgi:uncharacterized protein YigA (DUF484 family)
LKNQNKTTKEMDMKMKLLTKAAENNDTFHYKLIKKRLELLLYNSKEIIKKTKKEYEKITNQ